VSTLLEEVAQGLSSQGLNVEEDHGGLVVRAENHSVTVWVDETERVVRAEEVLCYPVDDFSEELCVAMDQLNEARLGLTVSYQEQQRALVASTVWTSPSRSPSLSQLHLLVGLLHQSKDRDGEPLSRIADGEATWEEVADQLLGEHSAISSPVTERFVSAEPPTRALGTIGSWDEPPTQDMEERSGGRTTDRGFHQVNGVQAGQPERGGRGTGRRRPPADPLEPPVRKTSRLAFQMAVNAAEPRGPAPVDLTEGKRSLGARLFKLVLYLGIAAGVVWFVGWKLVKPIYPQPFTYLEKLLEGEVVSAPDPVQEELARRRTMKPGKELFLLELREPLDEALLRASLGALGDEKQALIERQASAGNTEATRKRAYSLWREHGYHEAKGARLRLVKAFVEAKKPRDVVVAYLANDLGDAPPGDAEAIEALSWAPPEVWKTLIRTLGRPGRGAKARAAALSKELPKDTGDAMVLRAVVATGHAPKNALSQLVGKQGLEWARGPGKELITELVRKEPEQVGALLTAEEPNVQAFAVDVLTEAGSPEAAANLLGVLKDRKASMRTRLGAAQGIRKLGYVEATWSLVLVVCNPKSERTLRDACERALAGFRPEKAVAELEPYLSADRKYNVRHYAVRGLGVVQAPAAVQVLVEMLQSEPEAKVRRLVVKTLTDDYLKSEEARDMLNRGLAVFREVARSDKDAVVRSGAQDLYDSLTGG
jgi:hypothetical protein